MKKMFVMLGVMALAALPATAYVVSDIANPGDELDLYEIYNEIMGLTGDAAFESTAEMEDYTDFPLLVDLQTLAQVFEIGEGPDIDHANARMRARFADQGQSFGYVANADVDDPTPTAGDRIFLFNGNPDGADGSIGDAGAWVAIPEAASPIAFYDESDGNVVYSVHDWNADGQIHMVAFWAIDSNGADGGIVNKDSLIIAFEDRLVGNSDWDYNDLVVELDWLPTDSPGCIPGDPLCPEPASFALLGLGLVGAALRKKFVA